MSEVWLSYMVKMEESMGKISVRDPDIRSHFTLEVHFLFFTTLFIKGVSSL